MPGKLSWRQSDSASEQVSVLRVRQGSTSANVMVLVFRSSSKTIHHQRMASVVSKPPRTSSPFESAALVMDDAQFGQQLLAQMDEILVVALARKRLFHP